MVKTENHILELPSLICKITSLEKSKEEKIKQKGKFSQGNEKMMEVEIDMGATGTVKEIYYTLQLTSLAHLRGETQLQIELHITKEEFSYLREFLNRSVSPMDNYL